MNLFNQNILYSIPDEIGSFGDCSLNSYVVQFLNKHYKHDSFKHGAIEDMKLNKN